MAITVDVSDSLLRQVGIDSAKLAQQIADAKRAAVVAVRTIEARLVEELAGTRLRGAPNLVDDWPGVRFYGWRMRGRVASLLHGVGDDALVLAPTGLLHMAKRASAAGQHCVAERAVLDEELTAEDLLNLVSLLADVLPRHCELVGHSEEVFAGIAALGSRIVEAMAPR
jgi:hypothetical protein